MAGWLKLHRKLLDSNMYKSLNSKQRDVLFSCLMLANYAENEWEYNGSVFKCNPGQFVTSLDSIAKNCGKDVKVQSVRTALLKLEKWGFLTNESTKTGRLISICKWDEYQQDEKDTNKDDNKEPTKSQQSSNKDLTPKEEGKEDKNDKEEIIKGNFELFWNHFHKITDKPKEKKEAAFKHWKKLKLDEQRKAYAQIEKFSKSKNDKQYLVIARTYLSDKVFNDEFIVSSETKNEEIKWQ